MNRLSLEDISNKEYVVFDNGEIALIDNLNSLSADHEFVTDGVYIFVLCTAGRATVSVNDRKYEIGPDHLFVAPPRVILHETMLSIDFECCCVAVTNRYIRKVIPMHENFWALSILFENNPLLPLDKAGVELFHQYYSLIRSKLVAKPIPHVNEVVRSLILAFIFEFYDTLERFVEMAPKSFNASQRIFQTFTDLLTACYPKDRSVAFYAEKMAITPKYLSAACKKCSGQTASEIIDRHVSRDIEHLMRYTHKSIKEIAFELGFPSISFFGKYVRRHFGVSPTLLRSSLHAPARPQQ